MRGPGRGAPGLKPVNTKKTVGRLIKYITKNKLILVLVAFLVLIASGAGVAGTYMLTPSSTPLKRLLRAKSPTLLQRF